MKNVVGIALISLTLLTSCFVSSSADFGRLFQQFAGILRFEYQEYVIGTAPNGTAAYKAYPVNVFGGTAPYRIEYPTNVTSYYDASYGVIYPGVNEDVVNMYVYDSANSTAAARVISSQPVKVISDSAHRSNNDVFGSDIAIDGDWLFVSATGHEFDQSGGNPLTAAGAVLVFKRNEASWQFKQKILASDRGSNHVFGYSVAAKNGILAISAPYNSGGKVYLYRLDEDESWIEERLVAFDDTTILSPGESGPMTQFGSDIAIDGNRVAISAPNKAAGVEGAVYVLERSQSGVWNQMGSRVVASDGDNDDWFGDSLDIDGDTLVVGAASWDGTSNSISSAGAVYAYQLVGSNWTQTQIIQESIQSNNNEFGFQVALSKGQLAISSPHEDGSSFDEGRVYIFTQDTNGSWVERESIVLEDNNATVDGPSSNDRLGQSIAFENGRLAIANLYENFNEVGAVSLMDAGAVYSFDCSGADSYCYFNEKIVATGTNARNINDTFGKKVAVHPQGWIVSSSIYHTFDTTGSNPIISAGAVWVNY